MCWAWLIWLSCFVVISQSKWKKSFKSVSYISSQSHLFGGGLPGWYLVSFGTLFIPSHSSRYLFLFSSLGPPLSSDTSSLFSSSCPLVFTFCPPFLNFWVSVDLPSSLKRICTFLTLLLTVLPLIILPVNEFLFPTFRLPLFAFPSEMSDCSDFPEPARRALRASNSWRLPLTGKLSNSPTELSSEPSSAHFPSVSVLSRSVTDDST